MASGAGMASCTELIRDLDIQEWLQKHYGFVPHPFWIRHCKDLYLPSATESPEDHLPGHECPADRRASIKAALRHFGLMR